MRIDQIFRRDINRRIEEVIKVELGDELTIVSELEEYVATDRIQFEMQRVLDPFSDTIDNPTEETNVWVSGFFGSGKSSFAKVVAYLLENPTVGGKKAADWFFEHTDAPVVKQLLTTKIHDRAPTIAVLVDLLSSQNVQDEGESIVLPLYRALLKRLGFSRSIRLAEQEIKLVKDGKYEQFAAAYLETFGVDWAEVHDDPLQVFEMSQVLHQLSPETFSAPDSFARSPMEQSLSAQGLAEKATLLLQLRSETARRIVFVVDEAGQYVARDVKRVGDLQGVAEAFQARKGDLWLIATSQQRLEDIVESLEGNRSELARVKDRFPIKVDLLTQDIEQVVSARVLEKSAAGATQIRAKFSAHRHQLNASAKLLGSRGADLSEEAAVRLYPLLPYQVQLFIDAVTARREGGMTGGSNRTLLGLTQRLVTTGEAGLGSNEVGALVTADRAYDILYAVIPPAWRDEVDQVARAHADKPLVARVLKTIALCVDVRDLVLDSRNIAVLLHSSMDAETIEPEVQVALQILLNEGRIQLDTSGYRLQSPEGKDWITARNAITPTVAHINRLRKQLLERSLSGLSVNQGRTFTVALSVGDENLSKGDVPLHILEHDGKDLGDLKMESRVPANASRIWWTHSLSNETSQALEELHRSNEMIQRRSGAGGADAELVARERRIASEWESRARRGLEADLDAGRVVFHGRVDDPAAGVDLKAKAQALVASYVPEIYTRVGEFSANLKSTDPLLVLKSETLDGLPAPLETIKLIVTKATGKEIDKDNGPLRTVLDTIETETGYGKQVTGAMLEKLFSAPPFGASFEVVQAVVAAGVRLGLLDVRFQGSTLRSAGDHRLEPVFKTTPAFRSAVFEPHIEGIPLERRVELARLLTERTGTRVNPTTDELVRTVRSTFAAAGDNARNLKATLNGADLAVPPAVDFVVATVKDLAQGDDEGCVLTALGSWTDLVAGIELVDHMRPAVDAHLGLLRRARSVLKASDLSPELVERQRSLADVMESGDLIGKFGEIEATVSAIESYRDDRVRALRDKISDAVQRERATLIARHPGLAEDAVHEALRPLEKLSTDAETQEDIGLLEAKHGTISTVAATVAVQLDEAVARGRLANLAISDLAPHLIETPAQLDEVLARTRHRVSELLADGKQVRLS